MIRQAPSEAPRHWHSRGYLPHFDHPGLIQSITFRLADSLPHAVIQQWMAGLSMTGREDQGDTRCSLLRERIERYLDQGWGACWLRRHEVADEVERALTHFDGARYRLMAWCVMPNHVHTLVETLPGHRVGAIVHSWKSFSSKRANRILERSGAFWMPDYFDRYIRDEPHFRKALCYIEANPVKAGLVGRPCEWEWSSARWRDREG